MSTSTVQLRRWTRLEYERMVDSGIFGPEDPIELLDGEIVEMTPQGSRHAAMTSIVADRLRAAAGDGYYVMSQLPLALDDDSEPEPAVAVVRGAPRDYLHTTPRDALLVVEISDSSLDYDRGRKLRVYARNGVPEYWIVNLVDGRLEVCRGPVHETYANTTVLNAGDSVTPLFLPRSPLAVADLLP